MSSSTHAKKAATNNNSKPKPLSLDEVYSLINSFQSASNSEIAELKSLRMAISPLPPASWCYVSLAYYCFMQEPHRLRGFCGKLPFPTRQLGYFTLHQCSTHFALCVGIIPLHTTAEDFFKEIKAILFPGNCFQKLKVVHEMVNLLVENRSGTPKPNATLIFSLHSRFVMFKKSKFESDKIKGLLAQEACHVPARLEQPVMAEILAKNDHKPSSNFAGQSTSLEPRASILDTLDTGELNALKPKPHPFPSARVYTPEPHPPSALGKVVSSVFCVVSSCGQSAD
ncbi:hypothetical protein O181_000460 [Austropuccinia psidii MF-1]|uniref:Uncharacterized protein n=1 Tax=Austropuccinia psidii MF-1 TaxID=1389203 RepID=A0A9Q3B8Y3_9BASI|nr:hypothetical protein [Austropuccinia psidii MF-1]